MSNPTEPIGRVFRPLRMIEAVARRRTRPSARSADFQMSRATPKMRDFANRLIAIETGENESSETRTPAAFHVAEKLRRHLSTLMGNAGFRGLLLRALALAGADVRWLRAVHVTADGSLAGLEEHAQLKPEEFLEGSAALLAQLLGLLVAFIGEDMTLRLVRDVWPNVPLDDLDGHKK